MADDSLLTMLRSARPDYTSELHWVRFLLDSYEGTGGYAGRVQPPAVASRGWVADTYGIGGSTAVVGTGNIWEKNASYLDQYPREDADKFEMRCAVSFYENYVATIYDLLLSYALKSASTPENIPDNVKEWRDNVTINGTGWDALMKHILARRAGLMGWCPVIIDQQARPEGAELSEAQVAAAGIRVEPYVMPLTPANVLDWYIDPQTGVLEWVKIRLDYRRQKDPTREAQTVQVYKIYDKKTIRTWEVLEEKVTAKGETTHPFGVVPLVSFQQKPNVEEPLRGVSMSGDACIANKRIFNLGSELDEHIRSTVFSLLQVPVPEGHEAPDELLVGNGQGVPVPASGQRDYKFISPEGSVAATRETRIANMVRGLYRRARTQFESANKQQSGIAKQWDFEETNRLLSDFVSQLARAETEVLVIVARVMGTTDETELDKIRVVPQSDFAVEDLMADLEAAEQAMVLNLGATMEMLIKKRLADRLVPNMSAEDKEQVEEELELERDNSLNDAAAQQELRQAKLAAGEDPDAPPAPEPAEGDPAPPEPGPDE